MQRPNIELKKEDMITYGFDLMISFEKGIAKNLQKPFSSCRQSFHQFADMAISIMYLK